MRCQSNILRAFRFAKNFDNVREVAEMMAFTSIRQNMTTALRDADDFKEFGLDFYFRIYIRIRQADREKILYGLGSEVANYVDMTDEMAMRRYVDVLTEKKMEFVRRQSYEKAMAVKDQIGFLVRRIVELKENRQ